MPEPIATPEPRGSRVETPSERHFLDRQPDPDRITALHRTAPLTDIHVHPSLKAYLFRRNLWRHYWSGRTIDPLSSRSDFRSLERGGVGVIWAAHHVPERALFRDCLPLRIAAMLLVPAYRKLTTGSLFRRLLEMMDALEREIARRPDRIELARSVAEIDRIRAGGKIAVVHTVEGAHVLEGEPDRLQELAERGVAMLTLTHFYPNGLAAHVDGMPPDLPVRKLCDFEFGAGGSPALTDLGRAVLRKARDLRVVVDVSHCTPAARGAIYDELAGGGPIVASHVGAAALNPDPYNLTDDEIRAIARTGGGVGVIFMNHWLDPSDPAMGLDAIWRTLDHIRSVTGTWDHALLGSDFDGFTDPPDDLRDASRMGRLTEMLLARGVPETDVKKILGGNARRVLELGWR